MTTAPFMLTAQHVSKALGISEASVYTLNKQDELPIKGIKFGQKSVRWKRVDLEEFLGAPISEILPEFAEGSE